MRLRRWCDCTSWAGDEADRELGVVRRLGVTLVLAYLGAGALVRPLGLGSLIKSAPILHWFTVVDAKNVEGFTELGIGFLLFLIGLELSYGRLMAMRRLVFGMGVLPVLATTVVIAGFTVLVGYEPGVAMIVGINLAFLDCDCAGFE